MPAAIPTTASTYTANQLGTPTQLNVAPSQTVQGQLANINNPNSAIIMSARNGANQAANANGLLNSTMAISAGDTAAYNAAIPIAEQDASTYNTDAAANASAANTFAVDNQNATNTANQYNAGSANTLTGEQLSNQTSLTNAQLAAQTSTANQAAQDTTTGNVAALNATNAANMQTQTTVAGIGNQYSVDLANLQLSSTADKPDALTSLLQSAIGQFGSIGQGQAAAQFLLSSAGATSTDGTTSLTAAQIAAGTPFMVAGATYSMQNGSLVAQSGAGSASTTPTSSSVTPANGSTTTIGGQQYIYQNGNYIPDVGSLLNSGGGGG